MDDKPIDIATNRLKNGGASNKRLPKGDFRKWHPARTADGTTIPLNAEEQNFVSVYKNRDFTVNDYVWNNKSAYHNFRTNSEDASVTDPFRNIRSVNSKGVDVPKIILKEFQPDFLFNWGDVVDNAIGGAGNALGAAGDRANSSVDDTPNSGTGSNKSKGVFSTIGRVVEGVGGADTLLAGGQALTRLASQNHINNIIQNIGRSRNNGLFTDSIIKKPVELVRTMFTGEFLSTYEIPYYGDVYLKAESNDNWSRSGLSQQIGSTIGTFLKENMSLDVPTTPTWKNSDGGGMPPPIEAELILYNQDINALIANYRFIHALIAGVYWTQLNYNQKSPNLFDVTIPGRLHYFYCSMDMEVNYLGKARSLNESSLNRFTRAFGSNSNGANFPVGYDYMFPDGYEVKFTIQSLMPNNFNMYLDYLLNGSQEDGLIDRTSPLGLAGGVVRNVSESLDGLTGNRISGSANAITDAFSSAQENLVATFIGNL